MWILPVVGYIGILLGFGFLTLAIASGLYYLSELVEEHTVPAKKLLTRLIYAIVVLQLLLLVVDRVPLWLSLLSIGSHVIYLQNLRYFPIVKLSDPVFIASCLLVLINHYLWFLHFSRTPSPQTYTSLYLSPSLPTFTEIASYFFLLVWLVPFSLFVSLSAGENVLPSTSEPATPLGSPAVPSSSGGFLSPSGLQSMGAMLTPRSLSRGNSERSSSAMRGVSLGHGTERGRGRRRGAKGLVRVAVDGVREWVADTGESLGLWKGARKW